MAGLISTQQKRIRQEFSGPNLGYLMELYEKYQKNPDSVDEETRAYFINLAVPPVWLEQEPSTQVSTAPTVTKAMSMDDHIRVLGAINLARNVREYGHLEACIDPLHDEAPSSNPLLNPATYQISEVDLAAIPAQVILPDAPSGIKTALDVIHYLRTIYTGTIAFEFDHVHNMDERNWLYHRVESGFLSISPTADEKRSLLQRLIQVDGFEKYLHRTFVGQKRFSIEGLDTLVPMLDKLIQEAVENGAHNVMIGMAHRGRLNVLAHVLGKPYSKIFSEFHTSPNKDLVPSEGSIGINYGWSGDVKYHLGAKKAMQEDGVVRARLTLANNPSHLEFVNPVVEGITRASQDNRLKAGLPENDPNVSLAILVHGDSAFPGEGIVAETLNLSRIPGYQTGGTIHIIANNGIGFTAEASETRSTRYASDLAKGFEIPVVHVNADDPEACLAAIRLAHAYRVQFHKDFLIDLVGYRRFGHNEMDDPSMTQPLKYEKISNHKVVCVLYAQKLESENVISKDQIDVLKEEIEQQFSQAYKEMMANKEDHFSTTLPITDSVHEQTAVPLETLRQINDNLLKYPPGFMVYPKLDRILQRRLKAFEESGKIDWAHAETLAFATILADGTPIRLTGQDSERGTFGQRHIVLHDFKTGATYSPLHVLPQAKAGFAIYNSPVSEGAIIGFEYGYNVQAPETFVLWEAQFGDFANAGQVLIDQFISSGLAKWQQPSSLVLLLPHAYEGQGPEHSSARVERFLELSAENNWIVANVTSASQYFHLLRLQSARLRTVPRPLVIFTPKSLLRNPKTASSLSEFVQGSFHPVMDDPFTGNNGEEVERLIFCSGKIAIDLNTAIETDTTMTKKLAIVRVEQLYPFPKHELSNIIQRFPNLREVVWVQEEPQNMGAWTYMQPRLREMTPTRIPLKYIGQPSHSSPAEGFADVHNTTHKWIIEQALTFPSLVAADSLVAARS